MERRKFIESSIALGAAGLVSPSLLKNDLMPETKTPPRDDISIAQWALVEEIRAGKWKNLDFPRIAREDFGVNGIEFVNTLFEVPTEDYLKKLKQNAADHGVKMVLIMCDAEGDGAANTKEGREQFAINHRKWVDIAHYLGCHAIRTNCRGPEKADKKEALKWAADAYNQLLEYSKPANVSVVIENHGGVSNDPDWMVELMKKVNDPFFGTYPDWRKPAPDFDNYAYLEKTLPYAKGMSYRNQPDDALTIKMIELSKKTYRGWYGIESTGREEIKKGIALLKKHLLNQS
ncbi:MAG TPA: TIM barrel protein [Chitinophagaceae bacterium]